MGTTAAIVEASPFEFTLGDRMRRSLKVSGLSRDEIADYLGVAPATVSTWTNDRIQPSKQTLRLWALRTGAPYEWLTTGLYTPRDSNPEPTDSGTLVEWPIRRLELVSSAA